MITLKIYGKEAYLENEKWTCEDKYIRAMIENYKYEQIKGYAPFKDLALADLVIKEMGGKIIKITGMPKAIEGRIY